ncbi:STE3-domain-containing protein [Aspergillus campestris IBT 28561]|uniref:STE3-domain-containing protein n=1 Tax=Aspergillus campestris (strain IBT 28561) TaxID=1392248 RepID=A0A2I1D8K6_ASPC2|nr:STE3-domain-containing protein [Aspergillus campestris IBT 28561]PKY06215.1 STE3-domain-containing protein [Aspergillus campestris IBT 28561]
MGSSEFPLYPQAVIVPLLAFFSIFVSIAPLVLHWKNRNLPACCLIGWFLILNLFNITNAIIWPTDDSTTWWNGVVLCDIEVKIMIASYVAVPGDIMCIFRGLACVLDTRRATLVPTKQQRWRNRFMELLFCVAVPIIAMITQVSYQANRYMIFAISGCVNSFDESWVSVLLGFIWPPIICFIAAYYCGLVLYRLHKYRSQFSDILNSSNSKLNKSRFMRLFFLSFIMLIAIIPVQIYVLYKNVEGTLPVWHAYSWQRTHAGWNIIYKIPSNGQAFFDRWIPIVSGFFFFIFFGCGRDAARIYRLILNFLGLGHCFACVRTSPPGTDASTGHTGSRGSRAKLLFHKKWSSSERTYINDPLPTFRTSRTNLEEQASHNAKTSWLKSPFSALRRSYSASRERMIPLPTISSDPTSTVCTNAWAGTSQSRGSVDLTSTASNQDIIRVKQVISQESEGV